MAEVQGIGSFSSDEEFMLAAQGIIPAYLADRWGPRRPEFAKLRAGVGGSYIDSVDADGTPEAIDDRPLLGDLDLPALVIGGRFDPICGARWSEVLAKRIPEAELLSSSTAVTSGTSRSWRLRRGRHRVCGWAHTGSVNVSEPGRRVEA